MTNQHPITPPPQLVWEWTSLANEEDGDEVWISITTQAARWGADQQLAEDAEWLNQHALDSPHLKITPMGESLKEAMRPKPPSLKSRALKAALIELDPKGKNGSLIFQALEQLND
jgi:hypothetical protein